MPVVKCKNCGKEFEVEQYRAETAKFCSKECKYSYRSFCPEEEEVIKKYYGKIPLPELQKMLPNRSISSIKHRARILGLAKESPKPWTEEEIKILKEHYETSAKEQIMKLLPNRSHHAIVVKARQLGLRRPNVVVNKSRIKDLTDVERAYLAGIIDGEGTIGFKSNAPYIRVGLTDKDAILRLRDMIGLRTHYEERQGSGNRRSVYLISIHSILKYYTS